MQSRGVRIEAIRFGLLIVLTIALASVAFRIDSHSSSQSSKPHSPVTATPTPSTSSSPQVLPTTSTRPPATAKPRATRTAGGAGGSGGAGGAGGGGGGTAQVLPVTGWDATVKLGALALILIGGGTLTVRLAGPSPSARSRQRFADTVQD
jgi:hypothetical protein